MHIDEMVSLAKEESRKVIEAGEEHQPLIIARTPEEARVALYFMPKAGGENGNLHGKPIQWGRLR